MRAKLYSTHDIQSRIIKVACRLDCQNIQDSKQGKALDSVDDQVFERMFFYRFVPYWTTKQIREVECYLNEEFDV